MTYYLEPERKSAIVFYVAFFKTIIDENLTYR